MKQYNIKKYCKNVERTNRFGKDDVYLIVVGLFGEVGSVMSVEKKKCRESTSYLPLFRKSFTEEMGDAFWYLIALSQRIDLSTREISSIIHEVRSQIGSGASARISESKYRNALIGMCSRSASLLRVSRMIPDKQKDELRKFLESYFAVLDYNEVCFSYVLKENSKKTSSCFTDFSQKKISNLPIFDCEYEEKERLPRKFEIQFREDKNGKVKILYRDFQIGNSLTDNIDVEDGFRYHDILHFANVAILHWSPTMRGFFHRKRRSNKKVDENQDGGRAMVIEEGLIAWLFSRAKDMNYFEGHDDISIDILKTIKDFVRGYEVEDCPMYLWKHCILTGYKVFREVRSNKGGWIIGDLEKRSLEFRKS